MADPTVPPPPEGFTIDSAAPAPVEPIIARTPAPQTPAQAAKDTADASKAQSDAAVGAFKVKEEGLTEGKQQAQKDMTTAGVDNLVSSIESAKKLVNGWSTGVVGQALHHIGGTEAAQLKSIIDQEIKGNVFLTTLQQRQQDSPNNTGSTPGGRILQSEVPMITGALGTLDPSALGDKLTTEKLNQIAYRALRAKAIINGADPNDPAVQKKYGIDKYAAVLPSTDISGATPSGPNDAATTPPASGGNTPGSTPPPGTPIGPDNKIQFLDEAGNTTRAQNFQQSLTAALSSKQLKSTDDVNAWVANFNKQNGSQFSINWSDPDTNRALNAALRGQKFGVEKPIDPEVQKKIDAATKQGDNSGAAGVAGASDALTVGTLPRVAAAGDALVDSLGGHGSFTDRYNVNLDANRGYMDALNRDHPIAYLGGELAGGLALPSFGARTPLALAKVGAAYGGVYGSMQGNSSSSLADRVVNTITGAGTGAVIGGVAGKVLGGREVPQTEAAMPEVAGALQDEGIPGARPLADPSVRGKMAYLETTRGGHNDVRNSLEQTRQGIADKVTAVAGDGEALTPGGMGETIQDAGTRTINNMKAGASKLYTQASDAAGNAPIAPTKALAVLDQNIAELSRNPQANKGILSYLQGVRGDLAMPGKTVGDIRNIKTSIDGEINRRNLGQSNAERIMGNVMDAAKEDISDGLKTANPDALNLYNQADDQWNAMATERRQVLGKLVGPDASNPVSGEQTMARVRAMMGNKGDLNRFNRAVNMMTPDEQANFRATLFNNIGQKSSEEPFSPANFLSQTRDIQPDALKTVFGEDGAKSVQNLRVASKAFADTQGALNNSRSGFVSNFKDVVSSVLSLKDAGAGAAGYAIGGPIGAAAGVVASEAAKYGLQKLSAKTLMNPDVSSWIRKVATAKSDQDVPKLMGQLNKLAAANSPIQAEIGSLRDFLTQAANDNVIRTGSAAASPDQRPNQQQ
jgi:hypothetical protein